MNTLQTKITETPLTKTQKVISAYVLDHPSEACFMTTMELAKTLDVSEASIIRFCRALGYDGFMDFQKDLRREFQEKVSSIPNSITIPFQKMAYQSMLSDDSEYILTAYRQAVDNLQALVTGNLSASIGEAADIIINSRFKYIAATRGNAALGDYFLLYLKHMLPNVETTTSAAISPIDHMCSIGPNDSLVLFSFPRYSSIDRMTARMAKDAGAKVIVVTDKASSDLAEYATVILTAPIESNTFFNSLVAPQFITEAILSAISRKVKGISSRLKKIDKYLDALGNY